MPCLRRSFVPLIRGIDQSARPTRACTIKQQKNGFYSQPQASSSTEDNNPQDSQPKRLKTGAHPDFRSVQSGEGAANENDSEEGLFLSQSESGDGIADQAIDSENANGNREFLDLTGEGAGDEEDGEAGLLLTQTERGDSIADQATAIDSETANSAPMVAPSASTPTEGDLSKAVAKAKAEVKFPPPPSRSLSARTKTILLTHRHISNSSRHKRSQIPSD